MRRPSICIVLIVIIMTALGASCGDASSSSHSFDFAILGSEKIALRSEDRGLRLSEFRPYQFITDAGNVRYYEESIINAIKRVDGEQTKEPNPRRRPVRITCFVPGRTSFACRRAQEQGPPVLDTPCLTRIDQLPLENRPPPSPHIPGTC